MRFAYGFAWGKLYLAILEMATSTAPLPERVSCTFRKHLGSLNSQNTPEHVYERLRSIRGRLAQMAVEDVDEDATIDVAPLTPREASMIAEELVSLYDELAKVSGGQAALA